MAAPAPHPRAALHAAHMSASFFPAMVEAADRLVQALAAAPGRPRGRCLARDDPGHPRRAGADDLHPGACRRTRMRSAAPSPATSTASAGSIRSTSSASRTGCPGSGACGRGPSIRFFEETVNELIDARKALLASGEPAPRDLLTLLLEAADPETGKGLSDIEVRANIVTFIGAGHETTANALSWSLYLLSQDERARARIEQEVDEVLGDGPIEPHHLERLVYTRAVIDEAMRLYPPAPLHEPGGHRGRPDRRSWRSRQARWWRSRLMSSIGTGSCGTSPTPSGPSASCRRTRGRDRPLRLSAVRSRSAGLHRRELLAAGGRDRAGDHRPLGAARSRGGARGRARAAHHLEAARRPAHAPDAARSRRRRWSTA